MHSPQCSIYYTQHIFTISNRSGMSIYLDVHLSETPVLGKVRTLFLEERILKHSFESKAKTIHLPEQRLLRALLKFHKYPRTSCKMCDFDNTMHLKSSQI